MKDNDNEVGWVKGTSALIVCGCGLLGGWICLYFAAKKLLAALGLI